MTDMKTGLTPMQIRPGKAGGAAMTEDEKLQRLTTLKKSCADFESVFAGTLVKAMRSAIPESGLLGKAPGFDIYDSMADQQFSVFLSQGEGLGLGQTIFNQMVHREHLEETNRKHPDAGGVRYTETVSPHSVHDSGLLMAESNGKSQPDKAAGQAAPAAEKVNK